MAQFRTAVGHRVCTRSEDRGRTGYGRSYYQGTFRWTFNNLAADIYPSILNQQINSASPFAAVFPLTTSASRDCVPHGSKFPSSGLLGLPNGISDSYTRAHQPMPSVDQWNLMVEHVFASNLALSTGYVGNVARHLNSGLQMNSAVPARDRSIRAALS
jgi:hypothetical protein